MHLHGSFFGYGSLVNTATHAYPDPRAAVVDGWGRAWRHTALRPVAFLTAEPREGCRIAGMTAGVPGGDWAALDAREAGYDRVTVTQALRPAVPLVSAEASHATGTLSGDVAIYTIPRGRHGAPDRAHPILQSYLDTVLQGYLRVFGTEGVTDFVRTTHGWDAPFLLDRATPRYPRAQRLSDAEARLIDAVVSDLPLRPMSL